MQYGVPPKDFLLYRPVDDDLHNMELFLKGKAARVGVLGQSLMMIIALV
jgi:hypothetical protein